MARNRKAPFSVCLTLVWAGMGQQEPFHSQSGAVFDLWQKHASPWLLNWIVLALLEAQWLVSLSPHRPPLAWWSPTTLWRCKLLLTVCLRCTQSWPDGGELFWPAAITLALQSSNYSLGIWVAGDVHSPSTACKARGECEICMKWQLKSSLTDPSTCAVWGGVFQDHTQPLVCAWFFLSVREENT